MSKTVFLDTQVFMAENFAYGSPRLTSLRKLCEEGHVELRLVDVTVREVKKKIAEQVREAAEALRPARKKGRILRNLRNDPIHALFDEFEPGRVVGLLVHQLADFVSTVPEEVLPVADECVQSVLDAYFSADAPFEDHKKSEFPDAFMLHTIEGWCQLHSRDAIVVSGDSGVQEACKDSALLTCAPSLSDLLAKLLREVANTPVAFVSGLLKSRIEMLKDAVGVALKDEWVWVDAEDGDGTVADVLSTELSNLSIVSVDKEQAVVDGDAVIVLEADVSYLNPETAYLDNSDRWVAWERVETTVEEEVETPVQFTLSFRLGDAESLKVARVLVNEGETLFIGV